MSTQYELDVTLEGETYSIGFEEEWDDWDDGSWSLCARLVYINNEDGGSVDLDTFDDEELDYFSDACYEFMRDNNEDNQDLYYGDE